MAPYNNNNNSCERERGMWDIPPSLLVRDQLEAGSSGNRKREQKKLVFQEGDGVVCKE